MRYALIAVVLNLLLIDGCSIAIDRNLVAVRDSQCKAREDFKKLPHSESHDVGYLYIDVKSASWTALTLSTGEFQTELYGCDANGHRFRLWRHSR